MTVATEPLRINLGCRRTRLPGYKNLDIRPEQDVDFVADARDLSQFADGSVDELRASNIYEHVTIPESNAVLKEWARVLRPGGILWLSVPDFDFCVDIYLKSGRRMDEWLLFHMFGEQRHQYQFHYAVYNWPLMRGMLHDAGFSDARRVDDLPGELKDASSHRDNRFNMRIALNVKATK